VSGGVMAASGPNYVITKRRQFILSLNRVQHQQTWTLGSKFVHIMGELMLKKEMCTALQLASLDATFCARKLVIFFKFMSYFCQLLVCEIKLVFHGHLVFYNYQNNSTFYIKQINLANGKLSQ
jgi:hypothetical protein